MRKKDILNILVDYYNKITEEFLFLLTNTDDVEYINSISNQKENMQDLLEDIIKDVKKF